MSELEFESYLKLLSGLLRLSPGQRELIATELRDHMEERLRALVDAGMSREEAVGKALEEFGDAAALAANFRHIAWNRKRRTIMRWTTVSVCSILTIILAVTAFWPETDNGPGLNRAAAQSNARQDEVAAAGQDAEGEDAITSPQQRNEETRARLERQAIFDFGLGVNLEQFADYLQSRYDMNVFLETEHIEIVGQNIQDPIINPNLRNMRLRTALDFTLTPLDLGYYIHDGVLCLTSQDKARAKAELHVYDCRAILAAVSSSASRDSGQFSGGGLGGSSFGGSGLGGDLGSAGMGGPGGLSGNAPTTPPYTTTSENAATLIQIIVKTVEPESWSDVGGWGSIAEYDGKLVVRQSDAAHSQIQYLLENLRREERSRTDVFGGPRGDRNAPAGAGFGGGGRNRAPISGSGLGAGTRDAGGTTDAAGTGAGDSGRSDQSGTTGTADAGGGN